MVLLAAAGCAHGTPRVDGVAGVSPSPGTAWTPPPRALKREPVRTAMVVPSDLANRIGQLTLGDVVDLALRNNPATRYSWAQARAAADFYGSARGQYLPTVTGSVAASRVSPLGTNGASIARNELAPAVSLSYLLLDFGGRSGTVEEARQALFAADLTHNATLQNTILQAETAYFAYMATSALLGAERAAIAEAQANLAAAEQRHTVGLATIADILQARTALSQEQLNFESIQGNLQTARGVLAEAMGLPANLPYDLSPPPMTGPVHEVAQTVDSLIDEAVRNRPDLAAARAQAAAADARVRIARANILPSLTLGTSTGRTYANPSVYGGGSYAVTFGLSIPIFSGFSRQYDIAAAQAQAEGAVAQADLVRQQVVTQVFTSYYVLQTADQRVATADELLASAQQSEQVAAGRYREGVGSIIDLLTAQSALANARAQQVQSRWQWYSALAQLSHDAGVLGSRGETPIPLMPDSTRSPQLPSPPRP